MRVWQWVAVAAFFLLAVFAMGGYIEMRDARSGCAGASGNISVGESSTSIGRLCAVAAEARFGRKMETWLFAAGAATAVVGVVWFVEQNRADSKRRPVPWSPPPGSTLD